MLKKVWKGKCGSEVCNNTKTGAHQAVKLHQREDDEKVLGGKKRRARCDDSNNINSLETWLPSYCFMEPIYMKDDKRPSLVSKGSGKPWFLFHFFLSKSSEGKKFLMQPLITAKVKFGLDVH